MRDRLFIGNYEEGIRIGGKLLPDHARKCLAVSPRAAHCVGDGAALLYDDSDQWNAYLRALYGFRTKVIVPGRRLAVTDRNLSMRDAVIGNNELVSLISEEGMGRGWALDPFISSEWIHDLAAKTGLPVVGMSREACRKGLVARLNSKSVFNEEAKRLGMPVLPSKVVRGRAAAVAAAVEVFGRHGGVMLRQAHGASGFQNVFLTEERREVMGLGAKEAIERLMVADEGWDTDETLVEEYLYRDDRALAVTATVLMRVVDNAPRLVAVARTRISGGSFVGGVVPADLPGELRDAIVGHAFRYASWAVTEGMDEGYLDVDFGATKGGDLVAFESNCRHSGLEHLLQIRRRLCPDDAGAMIVSSNDGLAVGQKVGLSRVLKLMAGDEDKGLKPVAWDEKRGDGVVVSMPPYDGVMGYVVLARTYGRATELHECMALVANLTL